MILLLENRTGAEVIRLDVEIERTPEVVMWKGRFYARHLHRVRSLGPDSPPALVYREVEGVVIEERAP
jgi:hypothetical protein